MAVESSPRTRLEKNRSILPTSLSTTYIHSYASNSIERSVSFTHGSIIRVLGRETAESTRLDDPSRFVEDATELCTIPARCTHTRRVCRGYIERSVPSCNPIDRATPFPRYAYPIYLDFPCVPPLRVSYVSRPAHLSLLRFHPPRNNKESRWINRPLEIDYLTLFFQRVSKYPRGGESRLVRLGEKGFALFRRNRNKLGPFNSRSPRNFSPRLNFHRA